VRSSYCNGTRHQALTTPCQGTIVFLVEISA
jgi:hypothetical protein